MYDVVIGPIRIGGFRQVYPITNVTPSDVTRSVFDGWDDNRSTTVSTWGPYNNYGSPAREPPPTRKTLLLQLRLDQSLDAIRRRRAVVPSALEERLYFRPRRVGRACGSRHRVMI